MKNQYQPARLAVKIKEAASIMGVSVSTIRRLIRNGEIRTLRKLRHPLIPWTELLKFVQTSAS